MTRGNLWMTGLAGIAVMLALTSLTMNLSLWHAEETYRDGAVQLRVGNDDGAATDFDKASRSRWPQPMFFAASALARTLRNEQYALPSQPWEPLPVLPKPEQEGLRQAIVDAHKALDLSPNDACFWSNWAWLNALLGDDNSARIGFEQAIAVDPNDIDSRIGLGLLMERRQQPTVALEQYAHAIATSPRILDSRFFHDLKSRWPNDVVATVNRALDILRTDPTSSPIKLAAIARLDAQQGETSKAVKEYAVVLSQIPGLPYTWDNLGMADLSIGQQQEAYVDFMRAAALDGADSLATNELASIDLDRGDSEGAEVFYNRALRAPAVSVHVEKTWRIYHVPPVAPDDLLPSGLLDYISPEIRHLPICNSQLFWLADEATLPSTARRRLYEQEEYCASLPEQ